MKIAPLDPGGAYVRAEAARQLVAEFAELWPAAWPTVGDAEAEVELALASDKIALAALDGDGTLLGWIGAQPMYGGNVWELHPLVVGRAHRRRGIGRALVAALESALAERGALTLWLGTDDDVGLTSVGRVELYGGIAEKLGRIGSDPRHPFGFWRRVGFEPAGIVPDANGPGRPDILMAKRVGGAT